MKKIALLSILLCISFGNLVFADDIIISAPYSDGQDAIGSGLGQSFTATGNGVLSQVKLISLSDQTGITVTIYSGEGLGGSVLGVVSGVSTHNATSFTDYSTIDLSSANVSVSSGNVYTFNLTNPVTELVGLWHSNTNHYAGGFAYYEGGAFTSLDFIFVLTITASGGATPITLNSFTADAISGVVELSWQTASETNNAAFLVYRNDEVIARLDGAGTTSETNNYVYTDAAAVPGVVYTYVLADVDYANNETKYKNDAVTVTLANDVIEADFMIGAAYPNPFNPTAIIPVQLSRNAVVEAKVYTLTGREIATLANGSMNAGSHELRISAENLTTGLYLVKIVVEDVIDVQKIAFVK